ncbi:tyrosine-type recombinase/integrase [Kordia algicida OT-1]|uniref:Tyr recombinase domain-containing protein n=1 Tax=Kordia algicida OT-1 TaxID=391587 RepID=A9DW01_9FLAO|nr:tyrosine-type recombinase/integrase [Kordia algicida]EDP96490.1 hypothetical protein KAOT1_03737 [Kordia algicida OT-1]
MAKRKHLPSNKHKGLLIYCYKCKKNFSWTKRYIKQENGIHTKEENTCGLTKKNFSKCKEHEIHKYKSRIHIPGTRDKKAVKTHDAETYDQAVSQAIEFENEFKGIREIDFNPEVSPRRHYLIDAQVLYMDFLENIGVPEHKKKDRSKKHIDEIEKTIEFFNNALKKNKVNPKIIIISKINDKHVGYFHKYLLEDLHHANRTYNKKMGIIKSFFIWSIEKFELKMTNPFKGFQKRPETSDNETITADEFKKLLEIISPLNGYVMEGKSKKNRYRDYLKDAFELGLHTGGRREEVVELKWNMIKETNNEPSYIVVSNLKVERQKGKAFADNVKPKIIPITQSLMKLLLRLGYNENIGSHEYILAPNRKAKTQSMMDAISKGFSHYYDLLGTERKLQFKNLRKTYLTYLVSALGGEAKSLSSHSTDEVLQKHYIDKKVVDKAVKKLDIFG